MDNANYWLRQDDIDISRYLPHFLAANSDMADIMQSCSKEHDNIRLALQDLFNQLFINSATWGLDKYEQILDIQRDPSDDIYQRRNKILIKLQARNVSTVQYMTNLARQYFADIANVQIVEDNANYAFRIIADRLSYDLSGLIKAINIYKPAHLAFEIMHLLQTSGKYYIAGVIQNANTTRLLPIDNVQIVVAPAKAYASGQVRNSRIFKIRMEGVI